MEGIDIKAIVQQAILEYVDLKDAKIRELQALNTALGVRIRNLEDDLTHEGIVRSQQHAAVTKLQDQLAEHERNKFQSSGANMATPDQPIIRARLTEIESQLRIQSRKFADAETNSVAFTNRLRELTERVEVLETKTPIVTGL